MVLFIECYIFLQVVESIAAIFCSEQEAPVTIFRNLYGELSGRHCVLLKEYLYVDGPGIKLRYNAVVLAIAWEHFALHLYVKWSAFVALYIDVREWLRADTQAWKNNTGNKADVFQHDPDLFQFY